MEIIKGLFNSCDLDGCARNEYKIITEPHLIEICDLYDKEKFIFFDVVNGEADIFSYDFGKLIGLGFSGLYQEYNIFESNRKYNVEVEITTISGELQLNGITLSDGIYTIPTGNTTLTITSIDWEGELQPLKISRLSIFDVEMWNNTGMDEECEFVGAGKYTPTATDAQLYNIGDKVYLNPKRVNGGTYNQLYIRSEINTLFWSYYDFGVPEVDGVLQGNSIILDDTDVFQKTLSPTKKYKVTFRVKMNGATSYIAVGNNYAENKSFDLSFEGLTSLQIEAIGGDLEVVDLRIYEYTYNFTRKFEYGIAPDCEENYLKIIANDCNRDLSIIVQATIKKASLLSDDFELFRNNAGKSKLIESGIKFVYIFQTINEYLPVDVVATIIELLNSSNLSINGEDYILQEQPTDIENTDGESTIQATLIKKSGYINKKCDICNK